MTASCACSSETTSFISTPREQHVIVQVNADAEQCTDEVCATLRDLTEHQDARSQLRAISDVCKATPTALQSASEAGMQHCASRLRLLFEIFFQPYSGYLHRPLVATLRPLITSEMLRHASATAIRQCIIAQQQQWQNRQDSGNSTLACIPLAAAWNSINSCAAEIPVDATCSTLQLLAKQIQHVLEQSQSTACPLHVNLAHDLKVRVLFFTLRWLRCNARCCIAMG